MAETTAQASQDVAMDAGSEQVAEALDSPFDSEGLPDEGGEAITVQDGEEVAHADPSALGLNATAWVSLAMVILLLVALWKKVPTVMGRSLDERIAAIRAQLAEAEAVRKEAEELRASYEKKLKDAEGEAAAIRKAAEQEAAQLLEKSQAETEALITRRQAMAEDKIAAAERSAIADLRAKAAAAAATAAQALIAEKHDAESDTKLVDSAISKLN